MLVHSDTVIWLIPVLLVRMRFLYGLMTQLIENSMMARPATAHQTQTFKIVLDVTLTVLTRAALREQPRGAGYTTTAKRPSFSRLATAAYVRLGHRTGTLVIGEVAASEGASSQRPHPSTWGARSVLSGNCLTGIVPGIPPHRTQQHQLLAPDQNCRLASKRNEEEY